MIKPLTASELLTMALNNQPISTDRALATFADESNWVQVYRAESLRGDYKARECEWAFIGPVRPPYELAQNALNDLTCGR